MELIDTHCHLYAEEFNEDREQAVERALAAGVTTMLLPAIDSSNIDRQEQLASQYPNAMRLMAGLHPTSVKEDYEQELQIVANQLANNHSRYCAIGEIGLDLYWDQTFKEQQIDVLKRQLMWGEEYRLPVALHIRDAYTEMFALLEQLNRPKYHGVMHCFSGTAEMAMKAIEWGFYIGIGGVVTYKKSHLPEIVKQIPLERILLETDCPYLAPVPYRGKRNESAYLVAVAEKVAEIKECPLSLVAETTTANANTCFGGKIN